jgi:NitT/TauT family transport system permease protein
MQTTQTSEATNTLDAELAGIDALDVPIAPAPSRARRFWSAAWPKLAATGLFVLIWQTLVWLKLKPSYALPGPVTVFKRMITDLNGGVLLDATTTTLQRAGVGFGIAVIVGSLLGIAVARSKVLRAAIGSMITGLQTMPTIAWFPLTILYFGLSERAILFVVVLGAAPSIANGIITGVDHIPPLQLRAGRVLGAKRFALYRHVVIPASLPGFVAGLKQGWAFAWRSLMAGELLVIIANKPSLGVQLEFNRTNSDYPGLMATMLVILLVGIIVDSVFFGRLEHTIRRRWGLIDSAA